MNKKITFILLSITLFLTIFTNGSFASAASTKYPGTNITVTPGDIIYSPKSKSTFFVGHTAIVGSDNMIYHSFPNSNGKAKDSVTAYFNRFSKGDNFTILRPRQSSLAKPAAEFAKGIYGTVNNYSFDYNLDNFTDNYCSKFVWQAYYYGTSSMVDILDKGYNYATKAWIYPKDILNAKGLKKAGSFTKK